MHIVGPSDLSMATLMALPIKNLWKMLHGAIDRKEYRSAERIKSALRSRGEDV